MKAVLLEEHGDVDAFVIKDIAEPTCGDDQVIVKVKACSINLSKNNTTFPYFFLHLYIRGFLSNHTNTSKLST